MKAIIFDDELILRPAHYRIPGIELTLLPHADQAVAVARRERPDVVLMDFTMHAERSGAEAVAALCELRDRQGLDLFIVAISTDPAANQRMLDAGADDAVPKTHVRGYLEKFLERSRLLKISNQA
jgi:CheY-like chemotaxis protein